MLIAPCRITSLQSSIYADPITWIAGSNEVISVFFEDFQQSPICNYTVTYELTVVQGLTDFLDSNDHGKFESPVRDLAQSTFEKNSTGGMQIDLSPISIVEDSNYTVFVTAKAPRKGPSSTDGYI